MDKFTKAIAEIDRYNMQDPTICMYEGLSYPQEYFLSLKTYERVGELDRRAGEELLLAARGHHIGRWEIARDHYPEGRTGYLTWRNDLASFHADKTGQIMEEAGFGPASIARVKQLILKKNRRGDPEVQVLENAACLVFLQFQYEDFRQKQPRDKMVEILRKTLLKMDRDGRDTALGLDYSAEGSQLIREALEKLNAQGR